MVLLSRKQDLLHSGNPTETRGTFLRVVWPQGQSKKTQASLGTNDRHVARQRAESLYRHLVATEWHPAGPRHDVTMAELWAKYASSAEFTSNVASTRRDAEFRAQLLLDELGPGTEVRHLTHVGVTRYMNRRVQGDAWFSQPDSRWQGAPVTTARVRTRSPEADLQLLRAMLNWGWRRARLLAENPLLGMQIPHERNPAQEVATYNRFTQVRAAIRALQRAARKAPMGKIHGRTREDWIRLELPLVLVEATGRRIGAIAGLKWSDIKIGKGPNSIHFAAEFDKRRKALWLPIPRSLGRQIQGFHRRLKSSGTEWVFPMRFGGGPRSADRFDPELRLAEELAGVPHLAGTLWHAYRRKWMTERKHYPLPDLAVAGGYRGYSVLLNSYLKPDKKTILRIMSHPKKLRSEPFAA